MAKFLALALVLGVVGLLESHAKSIPSVALDPRLQHLGSIDGKSYYMDDSPTYDWAAAFNFCANSGLRLATINNLDQHSFLLSKHPIIGLQTRYWVGAKDYSANVNSHWVSDLSQVSIFQGFYSSTAIAFGVASPSHAGLFAIPETSTERVLCESY